MASEQRGSAGNTLVLFPVAVLILFGLGAVAIDAATVFLGQRRLADLAAAVANDAVAGVDLAAFYVEGGQMRPDPRRAATRATQLRSSQPQDRAFEAVDCLVEVEDDRVTARCVGQVRPILASFWPGDDRWRLTATETAVGIQG